MHSTQTTVCTALLCWFLLLTPCVLAQWPEEPRPPDSPAWLTLSDELTPSQLRQAILSPEANRRRYFDAVAQGLATPVSAKRLQSLKYFVHGKLTPELIPAWEAFDVFALVLKDDPSWRESLPTTLQKHGISESGHRAIANAVTAHLRTRADVLEILAPQQVRFVKLLRHARQHLPRTVYQQTTRTRDFATLAQITGTSIDELKRLEEAWNRDGSQESSSEILRQLQFELSPADWRSFMTLLREKVARGISGSEFKNKEDL